MGQVSQRAAALGQIARFAGSLAQTARKNLVSELKSDGSIVTNADREVETWLRKELPKFQGQTGFWGEEFGFEEPQSEGLWVVDPVDGTSNFRFGSPLWGVSIGLIKNGEVRLGAVYLPDLDELYLGERGGGSFLNGERIPQIPSGPIQSYELVGYSDNILRLYPEMKIPGKMRLTGSFVVEGTFVPVQRFRGLVGYRERLYDIAACLVIAGEAGADIRYGDGAEFLIQDILKPCQINKPWIIFPKESGFHGL
jgi:fructose-1,6-bisphosphatase/inositol monophosphatase family enzyme